MKMAVSFQWIILVLLCIVFLFFGYDFFIAKKYITALLFSGIGFLFLGYSWILINQKIAETEKIITSIRRKDFTLFPKEDDTNELKNEAVKLYYQAKNENTQLTSFKLLYENILAKQEIGFLILNKTTTKNDWNVFFCNPAFLNILQVPKYNDWDFYKEKSPNFYTLIESTNYRDSQEFIDISVKESSKQSFSIRTTRIESPDQIFCVVSLESVQKIIDKKEKLAWNNLMKVISHELLNTLTPVNSLIQNLEYLAEQDELNKDDQDEMKGSLQIINSKSQQLLHFIDSYRQVAELPKPKKSLFNLKITIENVLKIFDSEFKSKNIKTHLNIAELNLNADEKMVERVLVNLLTNSMNALIRADKKEISIETQYLNNRTVIRIQDSGEGINDKIQDKIFLPFFTTRQNGSGIGLTLAKSIMEAHNGYIVYRNVEGGSVFEVWFV
ncbi:sensor histidine kinase [Chryseobacterium taklimakanense]|uniref:histidine kinase n=2 Tax=Chryseobacterium taklimakanense TaxID=536441 RepID=A0A3G8WFJ3_9FLAO|nr:sensor histidine kinase [Chryseobacterium taklimakanense]